MAILNLDEYTPQTNVAALTAGEQSAKAKQVKTMGVIALVLTACGLIPVVGIFTVIAAQILARKALKISRQNLVPVEYEKPAYWASIISLTLLVLSVIGIFMMLL